MARVASFRSSRLLRVEGVNELMLKPAWEPAMCNVTASTPSVTQAQRKCSTLQDHASGCHSWATVRTQKHARCRPADGHTGRTDGQAAKHGGQSVRHAGRQAGS